MRILDSHCVFGRWPQEPRDVSLEALLESLRKTGAERGVAVSLRGVFYDHDEGNAETLRACREHPEIVPAATILPAAYSGVEDLPARLAREGFRMVRLFPDVQNWALENVVVERILAECAGAGLPVAIPVGKRAGVASAAARLAPAGCRVLLSDVYYPVLAESLEALRRREDFCLEVTRTCMPFAVELLCRDVGASRLVFGSRSPLECGRGAVEMIDEAGISPEERAAVLGGSLSMLLGGI